MSNIKGWNPDTFSFAPEFQKQIIAAMLQESGIFERLGVITEYKNFDIIDYAQIFNCIQQFHQKYKGLPSKEILKELIKKSYFSDTIEDSINDIYDHKRLSTATLKYIEDSIKNFVSCQALKRAIYESIDDLGDIDKHNNVKERIENALTIGASLDDFGIDVYEDNEIISRWKKRRENKEIIKLSSGWDCFDNIFEGFGEGEVFTFTGPAHSGKSMYLVNVGANQLLQKRNVLHISLEMSEAITSQRYDMRLLGLTKNELKTPKASNKIKDLLSNYIGRLIIKRFPSDMITASDIYTYMRRLEMVKKFVPDILIIDYADIMRSLNHYNDRRFELESIYNQVRNLGIEQHIPIVTATQLNRMSLEKLEAGKILTEGNIAESYGISRIIDCGVTINATPLDNAKNRSTIYVFKNRDGVCGDQFVMYVDFSKALIRDWTSAATSNVKKFLDKNKKGD